MPWNPQRIEQRIGRCQRYGQEHDVVVVNFLNRSNAADRRVFELLSEKFRLFEGVFGVSDEVLGALESGVDFEKRVAAIYQCCRTPEEIQAAFNELQRELDVEVTESMTRTRQQLLENFDDEVREKLRVRDQASRTCLNRFEQLLMQLTRHELRDHAEFPNDSSFRLHALPFPDRAAEIPLGLYELPRRSGDAHLYRTNHPLAEALLARAKERDLPPGEVRFDYSGHEGKVTVLEPLVGCSGWLGLTRFAVESLDQAEEHLILAAVRDDGQPLDEDAALRLLTLPGSVTATPPAGGCPSQVAAITEQRQAEIQRQISERNARFFQVEAEKLVLAEDVKMGPEREIKDLDRQIREVRRASIAAPTLEEKLTGQRRMKALEGQRNQKRRSLFDAQDEVDRQRGEMIGRIESKLEQRAKADTLFRLRWRLG